MKTIDDTFFLDTNVLLCATDRSRSNHGAALSIFQLVYQGGGHLVWSGQVVREYLVVATRPLAVNGLGLGASRAIHNIERFSKRLHLLEEGTEVSSRLTGLVGQYGLKGKRIHDANIVATMMAAGVTKLVTDDISDYRVFEGIEFFLPSEVVE